MKYNPTIHHRRSIRLRAYDYARVGAYFVTICTQGKCPMLGEIVEGEMVLNEAGRTVERWWKALPRKFPGVGTDAFVVMPNHVHGIIAIVGADPRVRPSQGAHMGAQGRSAHMGAPLHRVVQWFKTMTTNEYLRHVRNAGWKPVRGKLWQRNYYEHIIRNPRELESIREYVRTNPLRWMTDPENPAVSSPQRGAPWEM